MKRKLLITSILFVLLTSCAHWVKIANLTIVSTRNYERQTDYKELQRFTEGFDDGKSIRSSEGKLYAENNGRITAAIEDAIRNVPGGELMKNVAIYEKNGKIKAVGDVWGLPENAKKNQFGHNINLGDKVRFKVHGNYIKGEVINTEADNAAVKYLDDRGQEQITKLDYGDMIKDNESSQQANSSQEEFSIGDMVTWKKLWGDGYEKGTITGFKGQHALVQYKDNKGEEKTKDILKSYLTKIQSSTNTSSEKKSSNEVDQKVIEKPIVNNNSEKQIYKVTSQFINMRTGASPNSPSVMKISKGALVELIEKVNADWWKVKYNDEAGYVQSRFLSK